MTYKNIPGYCDFHEFYESIYNKLPDNAVVAEVGCYFGHSVAYLASLAKESGKNITIYAIDTFEGSQEHKNKLKGVNMLAEFNKNIKLCGLEKYIEPIQIDSHFGAAYFEDRSLDFCFIDAAHDYESVKSDIFDWMPKVKIGSILSGHDYSDSWPGVKRAVNELLPNAKIERNVWSIHVQTC
jgi:hypothetical protein